jgi:hypothetical protein
MEPQTPIEMPQPSVGGYNHGGYISMHHMLHRADGGVVDKALQAVPDDMASTPMDAAKQIIATPPARKLSPLGLYSQAAEIASALPQAKGSPQQMKAMLKGVKQEELGGYDDAFAGKKSVTRDEIAQHFNERMPQIEETVLGRDQLSLKERHRYYDLDDAAAKDGFNALSPEQQQEYYALKEKWNQEKPTKFGQYTLPGGENYREVLLKYPHEEKRRVGVLSNGTIMTEEELANPVVRRTAEKIGLTMEDRMMPTMQPFKSQHWDDPNVLAHLRMADRTGPNGEKILHVEEIQSDWGQKGKKEGFSNPEQTKKEFEQFNLDNRAKLYETLKDLPNTDDAALRRMIANQNDHQVAVMMQNQIEYANLAAKKNPSYGIPTAPYVTNTQAWTDLALKRALREAAEGGYDKLVWTPGIEQAKRYDLSQQVGKIYYDPELAGGTLAAEGLRPGQTILDKPNIKPEDIADYIGKEAAEKLLSQPRDPNGMHMLEGNGLSMGGEGMKGYYDKIVPNQLSKLVKKLDPEAKIGRETLSTSPITPEQLMDQRTIPDRNQADFHSLTITPKMRESIMKGQSAFKDGGEVEEEFARGGSVVE